MLLTVIPKGPSSWASWHCQADLGGLGRGIGLDSGQADPQPGAAGDVDDAAKFGSVAVTSATAWAK